MDPMTRRTFFSRSSMGLGTAALASLLQADEGSGTGMLPGMPHHAPKAKRVIYLFMSGGPSQMELFDHKPGIAKLRGSDLPDSIRQGQRLTGMTATQAKFPVVESMFPFAKHGQSGAWASGLIPHTAKVVDKLCFIK
ncbi:MAG: DUF1501 domain-containing protein, partial [Bryobacterales bacterium]|nr:DUF1501 domain-containing protein [Bryobacterales bacterium]